MPPRVRAQERETLPYKMGARHWWVMENAGLNLSNAYTMDCTRRSRTENVNEKSAKKKRFLRIPSPKFTRVKQQWGYHRLKKKLSYAQHMVQWLVRADKTKATSIGIQRTKQTKKQSFSFYRLNKPNKKKKKLSKNWGSMRVSFYSEMGRGRDPQLELTPPPPSRPLEVQSAMPLRKSVACFAGRRGWLVTNDVKNTLHTCVNIYII